MRWFLPEVLAHRDPVTTLGRFLYMSSVLAGPRMDPCGRSLVLTIDRIQYEAPRETLLEGGGRTWRYPRTRARVEIGPIDPGSAGALLEQVAALAGHQLFGIRVTANGEVELRASMGFARVRALPSTRIVIEDIGGEDREAAEVYQFGPAPQTEMTADIESIASA